MTHTNRSFWTLVIIGIATLFFVGCGNTNKVTTTQDKIDKEKPHNVVLKNEGGKITPYEELLLRRLNAALIPLPDTIIFTDSDKNGKGWVKIWKPNTVYLSTDRHIIPHETPRSTGYLYGVEKYKTSNIPVQTHVLAHEIGHIIGPKLDAELGRPAFGLSANTQETQAEIIGLVLMDIAFGTTAQELGFPKVVEYEAPSIKDKSVKTLKRQYCHLIKSSFKLTKLNCN